MSVESLGCGLEIIIAELAIRTMTISAYCHRLVTTPTYSVLAIRPCSTKNRGSNAQGSSACCGASTAIPAYTSLQIEQDG